MEELSKTKFPFKLIGEFGTTKIYCADKYLSALFLKDTDYMIYSPHGADTDYEYVIDFDDATDYQYVTVCENVTDDDYFNSEQILITHIENFCPPIYYNESGKDEDSWKERFDPYNTLNNEGKLVYPYEYYDMNMDEAQWRELATTYSWEASACITEVGINYYYSKFEAGFLDGTSSVDKELDKIIGVLERNDENILIALKCLYQKCLRFTEWNGLLDEDLLFKIGYHQAILTYIYELAANYESKFNWLIKPSIKLISISPEVIPELYKLLSRYCGKEEYTILQSLINGESVPNKIFFQGNLNQLCDIFVRLKNNSLVPEGATHLSGWLSKYFKYKDHDRAIEIKPEIARQYLSDKSRICKNPLPEILVLIEKFKA